MVRYTTAILKFDKNGEKTGWSYIEVPADLADELNPGVRKSYRVKGKLDQYHLEPISILPMGGGSFIIPLKAEVRKAIGKSEGAMLKVQLELSAGAYQLDQEFLTCLEDTPEARVFFDTLPGSHRNYFSKWIESAKTQVTREKRIVTAVTALAKGMNYAEMIRSANKKNQLPG